MNFMYHCNEDAIQIKLERRQPVSFYLRREKRWLWERIPVTAVVKYMTLTLTGVLLFRAGQAHALAERGYEALGGEVFALFLPGFYWMVSRVIRDALDMRGGRK